MAKSSKRPKAQTSYQELRGQLDEAMTKLQDPDVAIDDAIVYYETALSLINKLENYLQKVDNRVHELQKKELKSRGNT